MFSFGERATIEEVFGQYDLDIPFEDALKVVAMYVRDNLAGPSNHQPPKAYSAAHHVFSELAGNDPEIQDLKRRAGIKLPKKRPGIKEAIDIMYELHTYIPGNPRPYVAHGDAQYIVDEISDILNSADPGRYTKIIIVPQR